MKLNGSVSIFFVFLTLAGVSAFADEGPSFVRAAPVWTEDAGMNASFAFEAEFESVTDRPVLRYTCAAVAEVRLDGKFVAYGPARGPKGWFRVDEIQLAATPGRQRLTVTVWGPRVNSYYLMNQEPFLQAEVTEGERVLAATGATGGDFAAHATGRVRKVSRYSFQRPFSEAYRLPVASSPAGRLVPRPPVRLLPRRTPLPTFALAPAPTPVKEYGVVRDAAKAVRENWSADGVGKQLGFRKSEQDLCVFEEIQRYVPTNAAAPLRGRLYAFDWLRTGFPCLKVNCRKPSRVIVRFSEVLDENGRLEPVRRDCAGNGIVWDLTEPGEYALEAFEPYAFKYLDVIVDPDAVEAGVPSLRTFENPTMDRAQLAGGDAELKEIFEAARRTIAQNAVDLFTDCPGRERAGWLCDSFFSARAAQFFSGRTDVERAFLENFLLPPRFDNLPAGIVPMCYPSDQPDGTFIPNWAMWFVLEVEDYLARTGDRAFVDMLKDRVTGVQAALAKYENADGLLERLPSWVFVEWSKANEFTQDVNYPSNMLYAKVLDAVARLYGRSDLAAKAAKLRATVVRQSFDGRFFRDHAVRGADGKLEVKDDVTETCQYYAFFTDTATPTTHPETWKRLTEEFGPDRVRRGLYKDVWPSNAFIGNYLRLDLLNRYGLKDQLKREVRGYFLKMARATGTLWEHDSTEASCCHGFASYVGVLLGR